MSFSRDGNLKALEIVQNFQTTSFSTEFSCYICSVVERNRKIGQKNSSKMKKIYNVI